MTGAHGIILKTTDGGSTWTHQVSGTGLNLMSVKFPSIDTGYIAGAITASQRDTGIILRTINGGASWTVSKFSDTASYNGLFF